MNSPAPNMKETLAVVMHKPGVATERFIERHVRESFGGQTVVLARHAGNPYRFTQPLLVADAVQGSRWQRFACAWPTRLQEYMRHRYWGVPTGIERRHILNFWRSHHVTAVLAEFGPLGCWIAPVARAANLPMFVYFRGYDASRRLRSQSTIQAYKHLMPQVDGVFAVSAFLVDNLRRTGISHPNTHVIPSGTNTQVFSPGAKDPNLVVSVGRFVTKKRPDANIRAFAAAAAQRPDLRLEMVGDGPQLDACQALARTLGLEARIRFLGALDHAAIAELLSRAHVFLQHSITTPGGDTEGLPSSIQEAMAAGTVVISTRHAGIPEIVIHGQTGWLTEENDLNGYAQLLVQVCNDPTHAAVVAKQARHLAEQKLDTRALQAQMEAVMRQSIQSRRAHHDA